MTRLTQLILILITSTFLSAACYARVQCPPVATPEAPAAQSVRSSAQAPALLASPLPSCPRR